MEAFNIYINAFKRIKDYHNPAPRKEFNFFILFYFIFWILLISPIMILSMPSIMEKGMQGGGVFVVVSQIFGIAHLFPLLALVKRRLIDITPPKAKSIWWIYFTLTIVMCLTSYMYAFIVPPQDMLMMTNNNISLTRIIITLILMLINNGLSFALLVFYIFLMVKQGNIGRE